MNKSLKIRPAIHNLNTCEKCVLLERLVSILKFGTNSHQSLIDIDAQSNGITTAQHS